MTSQKRYHIVNINDASRMKHGYCRATKTGGMKNEGMRKLILKHALKYRTEPNG